MTNYLKAAALLLGVSFIIGAGVAQAQTPFSLTNMGQRVDPDDARMVGRGGWGMAVNDTINPGFKNLAGLSKLRHVAIKFTGYGDHVKAKDDLSERNTNRTISPDIRLALPIIKGRMAASAGFEVTRTNQYKTFTGTEWYAWDDTISGNEQFLREGTLFSVPLGLAVEVIPGLSIAGTYSLVNGTIRESVVQEFISPNNGAPFYGPLYQTNGRVQEDEYTGTAVTWSALLDLGDRLKVGASWRKQHTLDVERKISLGSVAERDYTEWLYHFPDEYRAGFDLRLKGRWHLGGDFQYMEFTDYHGHKDWKDDLETEYTYSVGLERSQGYERHGGKNNMPLRLGYKYRQWGYQVGGNPVEESFFSVGTGFPFARKMGQLDLALSFGQIGSLSDNGTESDVWRFTLSFTGLERWW